MALQPDSDTRPVSRVRAAGFDPALLGACLGAVGGTGAFVYAAMSAHVMAPTRDGSQHNRMGVTLSAGVDFQPGDAITWLDGRIVSVQEAQEWAAVGGPHASTVFKVLGSGDSAFGLDCIRAVDGADDGLGLRDWPCLTPESLSRPRQVQPGVGVDQRSVVPLRQYRWGAASLARYPPEGETPNATFDFSRVAGTPATQVERRQERQRLHDAFPGLVLYATMSIFVGEEIYIPRPAGVVGDRRYPGVTSALAATAALSSERVDPRQPSPSPPGVSVVREVLPDGGLACIDAHNPRYVVLWEGGEVSWVRECNLSAPAMAGPFVHNLLQSVLTEKAAIDAVHAQLNELAMEHNRIQATIGRVLRAAHSQRALPDDLFPGSEANLAGMVALGMYPSVIAARAAVIERRKELLEMEKAEKGARINELVMQTIDDAPKLEELNRQVDRLREKLRLWRLVVIKEMYLLALRGAAEREYLAGRDAAAAAMRSGGGGDVASGTLTRFVSLSPTQWLSQAAVSDRLLNFDQVRAYLRRRVQLRWEDGYREYRRSGVLNALERAFPALDARWRRAVEAACSASGEVLEGLEWLPSPWYSV
jgi:hypothetical protein